MSPNIFIAVILAVIALLAPPVFGAQLPDELVAQIQNLNAELNGAATAEKTLLAEQASLKGEEQRLISTKELLDGATKNFKAEVDTWKTDLDAQRAEATRQNAFADSHNAEIAAHNSRCAGSFSDRGFVNACNARAAQLNTEGAKVDEWSGRVNAWRDRVNDRRDTLKMKRDGLNERYADLNNHVMDWAKRKKESNYQLNALEAKKQLLNQRLAAALQKLEGLNALSQECKDIARGITSGDATNPSLNTPTERAHRCLQNIWDGAPK